MRTIRYWFTSDLHLGHHNIIRYVGRPFKDVNEMNDTLIRKWNERVQGDDIVFHAGDFCFKNSSGGKAGEGLIHKSTHYIDQLNGNIIFIKGNHDRNNSVKTIIDRIVIKYGTFFINIVHIPEHYDHNCSINFCGHIHEKWKFKRIYVPIEDKYVDLINVGVDQWNFYPVTFEEIYTVYRRWSKNIGKQEKQD